VLQEAARISSDSLPVIDVGGLASPDIADRKRVAAALGTACRDKGFFYIRNHGVAENLMASVFAEAEKFFSLPTAQKRDVSMARSKANRGYEALQGQTLEAGTPPDLKEGFYIGPEHRSDDPRVQAGLFNYGANQWPHEMPLFRSTMDAYYQAMLGLGHRLMRGLALSLDVQEDYFDEYCHDPMATLRLLHYPPQPASGAEGQLAGQKGAGAHTDFGGITLLKQDSVGGLQVWDHANQGWIHADPVPETYVVNLGDMMSRWTNGRYRSTLHRVINASGRERYSVPFFFSGNYQYVVSCIASCVSPGEAPKYPPITVEDHFRAMYAKTYAKTDAKAGLERTQA